MLCSVLYTRQRFWEVLEDMINHVNRVYKTMLILREGRGVRYSYITGEHKHTKYKTNTRGVILVKLFEITV